MREITASEAAMQKKGMTGLICSLSRNVRASVNYLMMPALMLLIVGTVPSRAVTIVIGSNSGVVWEGFPFSGTLSGPINDTWLMNLSLLSIGTETGRCAFTGAVVSTVNGVQGLTLAPGVILVPRMSSSGYFTRYSGTRVTFSGTVGLPENAMYTSQGKNMNKNISGPWCFSPEGPYGGSDILQYYSATVPRVINYSGSWVILADGTQTAQSNILIPNFYIGSYGAVASGNLYRKILPNTFDLRISTLSCTVATTTAINFGNVSHNSQSGAELARLTYPLNIACTQPIDMINANINVQFRAISGQYNATPSWLALTQGGGYITGEIDGGVSGSGDCTGTSGIPFNNSQLKVGNITSAETSKATSNQVIWRLCSGGVSLPVGAVDAAAEMLVTFN